MGATDSSSAAARIDRATTSRGIGMHSPGRSAAIVRSAARHLPVLVIEQRMDDLYD